MRGKGAVRIRHFGVLTVPTVHAYAVVLAAATNNRIRAIDVDVHWPVDVSHVPCRQRCKKAKTQGKRHK